MNFLNPTNRVIVLPLWELVNPARTRKFIGVPHKVYLCKVNPETWSVDGAEALRFTARDAERIVKGMPFGAVVDKVR